MSKPHKPVLQSWTSTDFSLLVHRCTLLRTLQLTDEVMKCLAMMEIHSAHSQRASVTEQILKQSPSKLKKGGEAAEKAQSCFHSN